jgi:hypothetical protein
LFVVLAILALVSWGGAEEKAKAKATSQEKAKRQAKPPARSYTDEDLKRYKDPSQEEGAGGQPDSTGESSRADREGGSYGEEAAADEASSPEEEEMWRARAAEARGPLQEAQSRIESIQAEMADLRDKLNPMSTKYVLGGNSTAGPGAIYEVEENLRTLQTQLTDARTAAAEAERSWQSFLAEARAAGASPAWLDP